MGCARCAMRRSQLPNNPEVNGEQLSPVHLYNYWVEFYRTADFEARSKQQIVDYGWLGNWQVFRAWALENGYVENKQIKLTILADGYQPHNCAWQ